MTNINKSISNRSKAYTSDEIAEVMEVLRLNNFNISQTSKVTGVSRVTLGKWRQKYHPNSRLEERAKQFDQQVETKSIAYRTEGEFAEKEFIEKAFAIKAKALARMKALVSSETNINKLNKALLVLNSIEGNPEQERPTYIFESIPRLVEEMKVMQEENKLPSDKNQPLFKEKIFKQHKS